MHNSFERTQLKTLRRLQRNKSVGLFFVCYRAARVFDFFWCTVFYAKTDRIIFNGCSNFLREMQSNASIFVKVFLLFLFNGSRYSVNINCVGKTRRIARAVLAECSFPRPHPVDGRSDLHTERRIQLP